MGTTWWTQMGDLHWETPIGGTPLVDLIGESLMGTLGTRIH